MPTSRPPPRPPPLRVLVVDDSSAVQRALTEALEGEPGVQVVGRAVDGEEALRAALELRPDCVFLDLEMPRMDGFTFLRLLMARQPMPVIVVSSNARKADVFKALELGALDFIAKGEGLTAEAAVRALREELRGKLATVRALRLENLREATPRPVVPRAARAPVRPARLVVLGASTGGPAALTRLLGALPSDLPLAYGIAQHMPAPFTFAFAERLGKASSLDVREARDGEELLEGTALLAPGGRHLRVIRAGGPAGPLTAQVTEPEARDARRYCPSVDVLFESAAEAMGERVCAVVLTGMGNDGRRGVQRVKEAGGLVLAECAESAVVYGMPQEAADTGVVDAILTIEDIADRIRRFAERR